MITFSTVTVSLPSRLKIPPRPLVNANVAVCFIINMNPLIAAVQKFSPVSTTWQYAFSFTYLINLWQQAKQHLMQFMMYFIAGTAESKFAFFIF